MSKFDMFTITGIDGLPTIYVDTQEEGSRVIAKIHGLRAEVIRLSEALERIYAFRASHEDLDDGSVLFALELEAQSALEGK